MPAWWTQLIWPKTVRGNDLVNKRLVLDPDKPPEDTQFPGMKMLHVTEVDKDGNLGQKYKVMVTEKDISTAIECMVSKKTFSFGKAKDAEYATVEVWRV